MMTASAAAYRATVALRLLCVFYCCPNSITPIKLFCLRLGSPQPPIQFSILLNADMIVFWAMDSEL